MRQKLSKRYARSTVTLTMAYAGRIMRTAPASGGIGREPDARLEAAEGARRPARRPRQSGQVPTRAEALAILEGAPLAYRAAIALGLTGLRIGEVLGMSADRLELDRRMVTIDRQLQRIGGQMVLTTPKAEKTRTLKIPGVVALELRRHLRDHQGDAPASPRRSSIIGSDDPSV